MVIYTGYRNISLVARKKDLLEKTARDLKKMAGGQGKFLPLPKDLLIENDCKSTVEETVKYFGSMQLQIDYTKEILNVYIFCRVGHCHFWSWGLRT